MKKLYAILMIMGLAMLCPLFAQVPDDFPSITTVLSGETGEGPVFLAVASEAEGVGYYLILLENDGTILKYRKLEDDYAYDFKMQPDGQLSYAQFLSHHSYVGGGNVEHTILDLDLNVQETVQMENGYIAEAHDFQLLPNGHYLLFGYYLTPDVDVSQLVDGGHPSANVSGGIIQELDAEHRVVWQWRSWDHYDFADYNFSGPRDKRETVSKFHLNTIGLDHDGHLLVATPIWVKKINRQTGEVIWDLGGDDNDFSFVGVDSTEGVDHMMGHAFYLLENGNYLVYDNGGSRRPDPSSEVHEYSLDQENLVATHVWTYARTEDSIGGWHRGNAFRLPNGNTIIGWGGADAEPIPTATEVDAQGKVVFEAFFDNPQVESYRAFRFPLDVETPFASHEEENVSPDEYGFIQGDTLATGITVQIDDRTGDGYNSLKISRYEYAPLHPVFPGRAPLVKAKRVVMETFGITSITGQIIFDVAGFQIGNPSEIVIYYREFPGSGLFIPLGTTYNPVKGEISANFSRPGEFIIAWPDIGVVSLPAKLISPAEGEKINQDLPVKMEWGPDGFFSGFQLQVSQTEDFSSPEVDVRLDYTTTYTYADADPNTVYYWRVKTLNEGSESEWSGTGMFETSEPMIVVTSPVVSDQWQVGLDYWILWEDNLEEDVVLELWKSGSRSMVIDTVSTSQAYEWEIPFEQETGTDYALVARGLISDDVAGESGAFALIDTVQTGIFNAPEAISGMRVYPNPAQGALRVDFNLDRAGHVRLRLFDMGGRQLDCLFEGPGKPGPNSISCEFGNLDGGMYILDLSTEKGSRKQIIVIDP